MYFRFSTPCKHKEELYGWFMWFVKKKIGCAIFLEKTTLGYRYSLFKEGKKWISINDNDNLKLSVKADCTEKIIGKLVKKYDPRGVFDVKGM